MNQLTLKTLLVSTSLLLIAVVYINNNQRNTIASFTSTPTAIMSRTICNITDPPIFLGLVGGEDWQAARFRDLCREFTINEESLQIRITNLKKLNIDVSEELKGLRALRATRFSEEGFVICPYIKLNTTASAKLAAEPAYISVWASVVGLQ